VGSQPPCQYSNKLVKLLHLVGWFIWIAFPCVCSWYLKKLLSATRDVIALKWTGKKKIQTPANYPEESIQQGKRTFWRLRGGSVVQTVSELRTSSVPEKFYVTPKFIYSRNWPYRHLFITLRRSCVLFYVRGSVHHSTILTVKNQTRCNSVSKFLLFLTLPDNVQQLNAP